LLYSAKKYDFVQSGNAANCSDFQNIPASEIEKISEWWRDHHKIL